MPTRRMRRQACIRRNMSSTSQGSHSHLDLDFYCRRAGCGYRVQGPKPLPYTYTLYPTTYILQPISVLLQGWPMCHQAMLGIGMDAGEDPAVRATALQALQRMLEQCSVNYDAKATEPAACSATQGDGCGQGIDTYDVFELLARREFWTERLAEVCHH